MPNLDEYLIKLGFKLDEAQWRTFTGAVTQSSNLVMGLGKSAVWAAESIGVAVETIARRYEQLYYTSQRTGAGAGQLLNYSFAATQIGISSEAARHSVEAFTQALRLNPGLSGLLTNLGVGAADPVARMQTLVDKLKSQFGEQGYFAAAQVANMFGLDEQTFRQMWMNLGLLKTAQDENAQRLKDAGLNADVAAKKFTDFGRAVNQLYSALDVLKDRIALSVVSPLKKEVDLLTAIIDTAAWAYNDLVGGGDAQPPAKAEGAAASGPVKSSKAAPGSAAGVIEYFTRQGWTREQATGIAANLYAESGIDPAGTNKNGMYGAAQWNTRRRGDFQAWSGHDIHGSKLEEQLAFIQYELTQGKERGAGSKLQAARTAGEAGYAFGHYYERPDLAGDMVARQRGQLAGYWGARGGGGGAVINQTNNITVTGATDPRATADSVAVAVGAQNQQLRLMQRGDTVR